MRFLLLLSVLLTTAALALSVGSPAQAHSELIGSTPADGDYTEELLTEVVLEFNEDIQPLGTEVAVTDPSGASANDGEVVIDGPVVTQPISTGESGTYTVTWRAVSTDGHPISGELSFGVGVPLADDAETSEEATDETAQEPPSATTDEADGEPADETSVSIENINSPGGLSTAALIAIVVVALALVAAVVWLLRRRRQAR